MNVFSDRIGRGLYWFVLAFLMAANAVIAVFLPSDTWALLLPLSVTLPVWLLVAAARARDMGLSGWLSLVTLIPLTGWAVALWFGFASSQANVSPTPAGS